MHFFRSKAKYTTSSLRYERDSNGLGIFTLSFVYRTLRLEPFLYCGCVISTHSECKIDTILACCRERIRFITG